MWPRGARWRWCWRRKARARTLSTAPQARPGACAAGFAFHAAFNLSWELLPAWMQLSALKGHPTDTACTWPAFHQSALQSAAALGSLGCHAQHDKWHAGDAEAILRRAEATAKGLAVVAGAMGDRGGADAAALRVAEQYVTAFGQVAKAGTTVLLPAAVGDPAAMVAQALAIYRSVGARRSAALLLHVGHLL